MKKILLVAISLFLNLIFVTPVFAGNNLTINCDQNACHKDSDLPIFNETNIYPGFSTQYNLTLNSTRSETCNLNFSADNKDQSLSPLSEQIKLEIKKGNSLWYTGSLYDLLIKNDGTLSRSLGQIDPQSQSTYQWSASFDHNAGNEFQNTSSHFDINFNFTCENDSSNNNPVSDGNPAPPVCNNSVPNAPTGFYTRRNTTGSVTLFWDHPTTPFTHYLAAYGTTPGNYLYGNPNVGNDDHYTVRGLTPGAQYCFYIRTINGCMPGDKTQELCVNSGSTILANTSPPTGFQSGVLGATTDNNEGNSEVLGISTENGFNWWWLLLLVPIQAILLILLRQ